MGVVGRFRSACLDPNYHGIGSIHTSVDYGLIIHRITLKMLLDGNIVHVGVIGYS